MPELPDITVYLEGLERRVVSRTLLEIDLHKPFVLRTVDPSLDSITGQVVRGLRRIGKRIVFEFEESHFLVIHLMIAGRLRWREPDKKPPGRTVVAGLRFEHGTLWMTEASSKKRASWHLVQGEPALAEFERGGLEVMAADLGSFSAALQRESRTLKRALTDPRIFSGIGNAYSDEILFAARLSPLLLTSKLTPEQCQRLFHATRTTLADWTERLREEVGEGFPEKVTAFRAEMAVHGRFGQPCTVCGKPIQRIRYASNECNYCVICQNEGRLLADRGLSQLMRKDWPKTLEDLEERRQP